MEETTPPQTETHEHGVPIPIDALNRKFNIRSCVVCGRGGHTRTTLLTVIVNVVSQEQGYACTEHVKFYVRPKDIKTRKRA